MIPLLKSKKLAVRPRKLKINCPEIIAVVLRRDCDGLAGTTWLRFCGKAKTRIKKRENTKTNSQYFHYASQSLISESNFH